MKLLVIHGHDVACSISECSDPARLYILNYQWKQLKKLSLREGFILYGFPFMAFSYIPEEKLNLWHNLWRKWSSDKIFSSSFSWQIFPEPLSKVDYISLLYNYHERLSNFDNHATIKYEAFKKECDMCHNFPSSVKSNETFLCNLCFKWNNKKEKILSSIKKDGKFLLVYISFDLWEKIVNLHGGRWKDPPEAFNLYKTVIGNWASLLKERGNKRCLLVYENWDELLFIIQKRWLFTFISKLRKILCNDNDIHPDHIMITLTYYSLKNKNNKEYPEDNPLDIMNKEIDRKQIHTGELLIFSRRKKEILQEKSQGWHMQWIYSPTYIKMPRNLYDFHENLDWNSFNLLKDSLEKLHNLFKKEDIKILKEIFDDYYEINEELIESIKSFKPPIPEHKIKLCEKLINTKFSKKEIKEYLKKLRLNKGLIKIILDKAILSHEEIEANILFNLSRLTFISNIEQREFINFLYNTLSYPGVKCILQYEPYYKTERIYDSGESPRTLACAI